MYFYKISDYNYNWTTEFELVHEKKFSDEEFKNLIEEAVIKIIKNNDPIIERTTPCYFRYSDINEKVLDILVNDYGFNRLEFASKYQIWNDGNILKPYKESTVHDTFDDLIKMVKKNTNYNTSCPEYKEKEQDFLDSDKNDEYYSLYKHDYEKCSGCKYGGMLEEKVL